MPTINHNYRNLDHRLAVYEANRCSKTVLPNGTCVPYAAFNGGCNDNIVTISASGGFKTRGNVEPNILAATASMVVSDPKGNLHNKYAEYLRAQGFDVKNLNFIDPANSIKYNPIEFIRCSDDVLTLATMIVYLDGARSTNDPFWERSSVLLLCALIGLLAEGCTEVSRDFSGLIQLLSKFDTDKLECKRPCAITEIFDRHCAKYRFTKHESSWAYEQFQKFLGLSHKTFSCVLATLHSILARIDTKEIRTMTSGNEIDFTAFGTRKTALFIEVSDTDRAKDLMVNLFYSQAMNELCRYADSLESNRLPVPVRFILDDFGTTARIEGFEKIISNIRSRNISVMMMLQSIAQLREGYGQSWETILDNCDTTIYMGGNNVETAKYISQLINKPLNRVLGMPRKTNWIFRRGEGAVFSDTIDVDEYLKLRGKEGISL